MPRPYRRFHISTLRKLAEELDARYGAVIETRSGLGPIQSR
jgi:hypothetical protein